jgi:DNA invertase Pin-like site-specific DNA recombinase
MGVRVVEAEGGTDLTEGNADNPTAVLIRQVLGAVAEFEKSALVSKLRGARNRRRAREGRCEGIKPFGEKPDEAETVALAKRLHRKNPRTGRRRTYAEIARKLEAEGRETRSRKPWSPDAVRNVLRSDKRKRVRVS